MLNFTGLVLLYLRLISKTLSQSRRRKLVETTITVNMAAIVRKMCSLLTKKSVGNVCYNSNRASIAKIRRNKYVKMYPTLLVLPNGSTITIRYHEPRMIIKLPPDVDSMSEEEKRKYFYKQKPKDKVIIEEDIEDSFDANQYINLWKKE